MFLLFSLLLKTFLLSVFLDFLLDFSIFFIDLELLSKKPTLPEIFKRNSCFLYVENNSKFLYFGFYASEQ
jgi:hypothetical protein